jgi:AraC-like DNA-binding protein
MSRTRHTPGPQVRASSVTVATRWTYAPPPSDWAQLVFTSRGAITVAATGGAWVAPQGQAVWIPVDMPHTIEVGPGAALRRLHLRSSLRPKLPRRCRIVSVSPLLRELLRRALQLQTLDRRVHAQAHLIDVLLDELLLVHGTPLDLPMPSDSRALQAARILRDTPERRHSLASIARTSGASTRTLERLFRKETGISFAAWRQRARCLRAVQLLAERESVTATAIAVGYDSTSAFVAAFRRVLGVTPGKYFASSGG